MANTSEHSYDVVIVGGGPSALGLLRGLLERIPPLSSNSRPPYTIAVIDRGGKNNNNNESSVLDWYSQAHAYDVVVDSVAQVGCKNRVIGIPVGSSLGGGTNINAMLVTKPAVDDFDDTNYWSPRGQGRHILLDACDAMTQLLKKAGCCCNTSMDKELFSRRGDKEKSASLSCTTFQEAVDATGCFPGLVSCVPMAICPTNSTKSQYRRVGYYEALIQDLFQERPELCKAVTFYTGVQAQRIQFDNNNNNKRATSVVCTTTTTCDTYFEIHARNQIIVCCGAIYTPALLMASGIGDKHDLESLGIVPIHSNKNVGHNLRDHVLVPRLYWSWRSCRRRGGEPSVSAIRGICNQDVPLDSNNHPNNGTKRFQFHILNGSLLGQVLPVFCASYFRMPRTTKVQGWTSALKKCLSNAVAATVQTVVAIVAQYGPIGYFLRHHVVGYNACLLKPVSTGSISLIRKGSKNHTRRPMLSDFDVIVDPGYLTNHEDVEALAAGFQATNNLDWFRREHGFMELSPGFLFRTLLPFLLQYKDSWLHHYISAMSCPYFHWCGTCAVEKVVDETLQVQGVQGLRVCDGSVFANCISGPTSLTCAALGYATAPQIIKDCIDKRQ